MDFFNSVILNKIYTFVSINPNNPFLILLLIAILINCIFFSRNIIHVIILLLIIYVMTGIFFIMLNFDYLGYMFLIIYAGAIIILFIFVLMLIELKNFKNKKNEFNNVFFIFYIFFFCLFIYIFFFDFNYILFLFNSEHTYLNNLNILKLLLTFKFYNNTLNLIEVSTLVKISCILYFDYWFETLFIGFILLLSLIFIIYLFKK